MSGNLRAAGWFTVSFPKPCCGLVCWVQKCGFNTPRWRLNVLLYRACSSWLPNCKSALSIPIRNCSTSDLRSQPAVSRTKVHSILWTVAAATQTSPEDRGRLDTFRADWAHQDCPRHTRFVSKLAPVFVFTRHSLSPC